MNVSTSRLRDNDFSSMSLEDGRLRQNFGAKRLSYDYCGVMLFPFMRIAIGLAAVFCFVVSAAQADTSDLAREKRLTEEIIDNIFEGEPIFLEAGSTRFLAIYTESEAAKPRGAAIILHGRGFHPDWPEVVAPLRTALPRHGWHTLSLQMPVLHKEAKYYDYVPIFPEAFPRIRAGMEFLRSRGIDKIVLIAHSCGVHMSMAFIDKYGDRDIDAYVGIGMGATDYKQPMKKPFPLDKMTVPVLDVYGSEEFPGVLRMAPQRASAMKAAGHPSSAQIVIKGAEHYFKDESSAAELIDVITTWLNGVQTSRVSR